MLQKSGKFDSMKSKFDALTDTFFNPVKKLVQSDKGTKSRTESYDT